MLILLDLRPILESPVTAERAPMPHRQRHDPSKNLVGFVVGDVALRGATSRA